MCADFTLKHTHEALHLLFCAVKTQLRLWVKKVNSQPTLRWPAGARVPPATPSHFPSDRKQDTVFLYKFGFTAGKRKSLLAKVSL